MTTIRYCTLAEQVAAATNAVPAQEREKGFSTELAGNKFSAKTQHTRLAASGDIIAVVTADGDTTQQAAIFGQRNIAPKPVDGDGKTINAADIAQKFANALKGCTYGGP